MTLGGGFEKKLLMVFEKITSVVIFSLILIGAITKTIENRGGAG